MEVVSFKIDKHLRDRMKRLAHINWSEVLREALATKVEQEEAKHRVVDEQSLLEAVHLSDGIRKSSEGWSSTEEVRKWRETRRSL
jgi:predicted transcriptional regulator